MNDAVGFAFLSGTLVGVMVGVLFVASVSAAVEKKRVRRGLMEFDGVVYRITEVKP